MASSEGTCSDSTVPPGTAGTGAVTGVGSSGSIDEATPRPAARAGNCPAATAPSLLMMLAAVLSKLGMLDPKPKELPGENDRSVKAARDSDEAFKVGRARGGGGMDTGAALVAATGRFCAAG